MAAKMVRIKVRVSPMIPGWEDCSREKEMELGIGTTVGVLKSILGVPETGLIIVVNGSMAGDETRIKDGDTISFLPGLSGG